MKKLFLFIIITSLATTGLFAQKKVSPIPVDSSFSYGSNYVVYALPKTAFKVEVTLTCSHEFAGPYAQYAEKLFGISNVIRGERVVYSLKDVEIQSFGMPDTCLMYAVELSPAQEKNGMAGRWKLSRAVSGMQQQPVAYENATLQIPEFHRYYSDLTYMEKSSNLLQTGMVDGVVDTYMVPHTQKVTKSSEEQAQAAAAKIENIREGRLELLTGSQEVPYPAETFEQMMKGLDEMEKNYISLFTGFVVDEDVRFSIVVVPDSASTRLYLFSVSESLGFNTRMSAKPSENFYLLLEPDEQVSTASDFVMRWSCSKGHKPSTGYRVRVPRSTNVSLSQGIVVLKSFAPQQVYQFGTVETLPLKLDDIDIESFGFIY